MLSDTTERQLVLLVESARETVAINSACNLREQDGVCVVSVHGVPTFRFRRDDIVNARLAAVQLYELGYAAAAELEAVAGCNKRTLFRARQDWLKGGAAALVPGKRGRKGPLMGRETEQAICRLYDAGMIVSDIAVRLAMHPETVRTAVRRTGRPGQRERDRQRQLLSSSAPGAEVEEQARTDTTAEPLSESPPRQAAAVPAPPAAADEPCSAPAVPAEPPTLDRDPDDRVIDRFLACRGELLDAAPLFADRVGLPRLGVLLTVPLIVQSGVLQAARQVYGDIGPAFYGLRTSLMALLFMALLRIRNPESLKLHNPAELGWLLGLDRAPEMKTLRRKLMHLGDEVEPTDTLLRELVQRRVDARQQALGFLYVDGHVRVYNGSAELPKAHVARMRISMPATQEVWVGDAEGAPLFFVTQQAHGQLVSELPGVLAEVRELLGDDRRVTVVFDRGGWSPDLFARMDAAGFDVLTYRKGKTAPVAAELFERFAVPDSRGREHYELADTEVVVGTRKLKMRQVTRRKHGRRSGEHQTHIVTTRRDLPAVQVAYRMFERWRQENFFKYMRYEYAIDALVQYGTEPADPDRTVPNPAFKAADKALKGARAKLRKLQAEYGDALNNNQESKRRTVRGLKIATGTRIGKPLRAAEAKVDELAAARGALPRRVRIGEVRDEVVKLAASRKRLSDGLKMLAYQVETDLVTLLTPHYRRAGDDGRRLLTAALQSRGDLEVCDGELRVTLASQSSPHRTRAVAALCDVLDATETRFPGTDLRLRYRVAGADRDT